MGPTAAGKSGLALRLAARFPLEIVNADSVQVYRGMDIGSAKPSLSERQQVPHHLIDITQPDDPFSAGRFHQLAMDIMAQIHGRGHVPLLVGGTGLYFRVVEKGIAAIPEIDESWREAVRQRAREVGWPFLHQQLMAVDPVWAATITPMDGQRILRGLSVWQATGRTLSYWQGIGQTPLVNPLLKLAVNRPREQLYPLIDQRFDHMMEAGLLAEVNALLAQGYHRELPAMKAVGYRQLLFHLLDGLPLQQAVELAKQESRRYAKRQLTWLRREENLHWLTAGDEQTPFALVHHFLQEFGFSSCAESV